MSFLKLCEWLQAQPLSNTLRESTNIYPIVETTHVVSMCLFLGLVWMMDLRLAGIGNLRTPFSELQRRTFPWQMLGLGISVVTGTVLFYTEPLRFYSNIFFWIKTIGLVLAGANALAFHFTTYHSVAAWDLDPKPPLQARMAGFVSLVLWAVVVMAGRLIAYNWFK